ncbi:MAG: hypothetical protein OIN85_02055 [Candidatus Methanoperedens sp.]|nr:hypothetical protein [Candidatus Methanoperedens sp.]
MKDNPQYKAVYYYIVTILRTYPISFISLFILVIAFFSREELADISDLIMVYLLFFEFDFLMAYTKIKTPWRIRLLGAMLAENASILFYLDSLEFSGAISSGTRQQIFYFIFVLFFGIFIWFLIELNRILPNIIDWSGNSKIARSYRESIIKEQKEDPNSSSKYSTIFWGRKILSSTQVMKLSKITIIGIFMFFLYLLAGLLIGSTALLSGKYLSIIDDKLLRFIILFIIVLIELWNTYKEKQYKTLEKEKPEDEPRLSFVACVFRSKMACFYLILALFNFIFIFMGIFIPLFGVINDLLKPEYFVNEASQISVELNVSLYGAYFIILYGTIASLFMSLIFLFYLHAHRLILDNFVRRGNNLRPLKYQKYQEILIFPAVNYPFIFLYIFSNPDILPKDSSFYLMKLPFLIPMIIFPILLILNYKFSTKIALTKNREHIIWLAALPVLIGMCIENFFIFGGIIYIYILFSIIYFLSRGIVFVQDMKYTQIKKAIVFILILPMSMYFWKGVTKSTILFGLVFYVVAIIIIILLKLYLKIKTIPPPEQTTPKWFTIIFGIDGPYTIEELREHGYNSPQSKNQ